MNLQDGYESEARMQGDGAGEKDRRFCFEEEDEERTTMEIRAYTGRNV